MRGLSTLPLALLLLPAAAGPAAAQSLSQRGFLEGRLELYPQESASDSRHAFADALFRQEGAWQPQRWFSTGAAFDARADTGGRVEREWSIDFSDRGALRPALSVRRLAATLQGRGFRLEAGKQLVRWGKADILNPTDRFAPRDFLEVVDAEYLAVTAARLMWERGPNTIDAVVSRFTPSRIPAPGTRWFPAFAPPGLRRGEPVPAQDLARRGGVIGLEPETSSLEPIPVVDAGATFPTRAQAGIRWSHLGQAFEFSAAFFDGSNTLPLVEGRLDPAAGAIALARRYLPLRLYGADAAWPLPWLTIKGEVGYFASSDEDAGEYGIYVVQAERQAGEWFLVGGYAGEFVTREGLAPQFSPERGLAKTLLGRASYTIDAVRSAAFEGAVRQSGKGAYLEAEYSQAFGGHLRLTAAGTLIRGDRDDFFGQFRENSNVRVVLRYSY
jgi:hypothetical protein